PIAIRYPRGQGVTLDWQKPFSEIEIGKGVCLRKGKRIAALSIGIMANPVKEAIDNLEDENTDIAHYDLRFVKPLDHKLLNQIFQNYEQIVTVEDGCIKGGFGSALLEFAARHHFSVPIEVMGIPDTFIQHGTTEELFKSIQLDSQSISEKLKDLIRR
ncbi:MAG: 1-deoxy-D-xylulose-5-phosphate synthase, partial [Bacteroidia bacterium]|nr:1-deoxy-D-xylulose-5-phosphate synthase [Bacteroidia bacterium]